MERFFATSCGCLIRLRRRKRTAEKTCQVRDSFEITICFENVSNSVKFYASENR